MNEVKQAIDSLCLPIFEPLEPRVMLSGTIGEQPLHDSLPLAPAGECYAYASSNLPGDANGDMVVNSADSAIFASQFGQTGVSLAADFNSDKTVDLEDFVILRGNFGTELSAPKLVVEESSGLDNDDALEFGTQLVHSNHVLDVTIRNDGQQVLSVTGVEIADPGAAGFAFEITGTPPAVGAFDLAEGQTRVLQVTFAPTAAGDYAAELRWSHNDTTAPDPHAISLSATATASVWAPIVTEDFSNPAAAGWTYAGPVGEPALFAPNGSEAIDAEWNQSKVYADCDPGGPLDPYDFQPSSYSKPLGQTLTDDDYFQVGATIVIDSIVETTTFYQVANFGLYNLAEMGADRCMADNWSGNTNLVRDSGDFVEFNYFIGTNWAGRNIAATIGAHVDDSEGIYVSGSGTDPMWHNAYLANKTLPSETPLYVEVTYFGDIRRARAAIYTDADRTQLLTVDVHGTDIEQYYWTTPLPNDESFTLTDVAMFNYVGPDWIGGLDGAGSGSFDDLYVNVLIDGGSLDTAGPQVAATNPAAGSSTPQADPNGADPGQITVTYNEPLASAIIDNAANYALFRDTNGDGAFNDETPMVLTIHTTDNQAACLDTGGDLQPGNYLLRLNGTVDIGTGLTPLRDVAGNTLDGDSDGLAGGDWFGEFAIDGAPAPPSAPVPVSPTVSHIMRAPDDRHGEDPPIGQMAFDPTIDLLSESPLPARHMFPNPRLTFSLPDTVLHHAATAESDLQTLGDHLLSTGRDTAPTANLYTLAGEDNPLTDILSESPVPIVLQPTGAWIS